MLSALSFANYSFLDNQTTTIRSKSEIFKKDKQQRPRSRSVYTNASHLSDGSGSLKDFKQYDGTTNEWIPRILSNKSFYLDNYSVKIRMQFLIDEKKIIIFFVHFLARNLATRRYIFARWCINNATRRHNVTFTRSRTRRHIFRSCN